MRDFTDVLTDLDDGKVHARATALLAELVTAVMETGKKGTLHLKLNVAKQGQMALVKADLSARKPEPAVEVSAFFTTEDGELRRDDPRQLKLREVAVDKPAKLRTVGASAGKDEE